jgi:hypothetical protein
VRFFRAPLHLPIIIIIIIITVETVEHMIQATADLGIKALSSINTGPLTMAVVAGLAFSPFANSSNQVST